MSHEFEMLTGQTFVSGSFPDFLELVNNLEPKSVLVKLPGHTFLDDEGISVRCVEYTFYTPDEKRGEFTDIAKAGKEVRIAEVRIGRLKKMFPQVNVTVIGQGKVGSK